MNFIYKALATTVLFTGISLSLVSQETSKFYTSYGFSMLTDYYRAPVRKYEYSINDKELTEFYSTDGISLFTAIARYRYNLYDVHDNLAFGLTASPSMGFSLAWGDQGGVGVVNLPLWLSMELGAGSTYNSAANIGGFFGLGMEYTKFPLFKGNDEFPGDFKFKTSWVQPVVAMGIRYWSKRNILREITMKYGFGPREIYSYNFESNYALERRRSATFRISFNYFMNY